MKRKTCKECPWVVKSSFNEKFVSYMKQIFSKKPTLKHKCHMINSNIWNNVNDKNCCVGIKK